MRRPVTVLLFLLGAITPRLAAGPPSAGPAPDYAQEGAPDQAKGRAILEQLRQSGMAAGSYYLTFDLRQMPRRGDERVFHGQLWGGRNEIGPVMRILVAAGAGGERRLLVQDGPQASVWSCDGGRVQQIKGAADLAPLVSGVEITAFDLQMPFFYWPDARLAGINRVRGRPAYVFLFRPPPDFVATHPEITAVRAFLDTQYPNPVQTEIIGANGRVLKTLSLVDLKKIGSQWMLKDADVRNETTRDKTRFSLTGAALGLNLDPSLFLPAQLSKDIAPPAAGRIEPINP